MAGPQYPSALLENLVEFAPDALLVVDGRGRIVLANAAAEKLFGFDCSELLGTSIERLIPERLRALHARHRQDYAQSPRTREMGAATAELVAVRKDGSEFPVEIRLSPVRLDGQALVAAAVRDGTDRRQAVEVLKAAQQEADRANAAKSRLLATASHDLRQPLQALQLLNAALQQQIDQPEAQELLVRQSEALESMAHLLNSLLDLSRLEAGAVKPEIEEVSLAEVFGALQRAFEPLAEARGLTLSVSAELRYVRTDRTLFRQLLENLLANALKFTETGGVRLGCCMQPDRLVIEVADSGIGISGEQLERIFDEYYQLDRGRHQGVGLGLSIVKRIAAQLGLTLDASSEPGRGTTFRVGIPAEQVCGTALPTRRPRRDVRPERPVGGALVLLVEDDDAVRTATEFYLKTVGHTVISAPRIAAAERALQTAPRMPDLIITDYHLGGGETGLEAIARLREQAGRPLPALVLSGDTSPALMKLAEQGACRVLSKPVDVRSLVVEISRILESAPREDHTGQAMHAAQIAGAAAGAGREEIGTY
jgi:PAS domain S-box-containing protein